jgi:Kef-type K+ transport system membrane component KefB
MLILLDWFGKFTGGSIGARISGFQLREATTCGSLMSCKGFVVFSPLRPVGTDIDVSH